jgi:hypothetical protein
MEQSFSCFNEEFGYVMRERQPTVKKNQKRSDKQVKAPSHFSNSDISNEITS